MEELFATDVFGKKHAVHPEDLIWRPSVYGVVIEDDRVLLSPKFVSKLDLPGGGVNQGEDLEAAVIREIREETGIDVVVARLIDVKSNLFFSGHETKKSYHAVMIYYLCKKVGGEISTAGFSEYERHYTDLARWIPLSDIDSIEVASTVDYRPVIKKAKEM